MEQTRPAYRDRGLLGAIVVVLVVTALVYLLFRPDTGVRGRVLQADGAPFVGAAIVIERYSGEFDLRELQRPAGARKEAKPTSSATTGTDGAFAVRGFDHSRVLVRVAAPGFGTRTQYVAVEADWVELAFTLLPAARLAGRVIDAQGKRAPATLTIAGSERKVDREFSMDDLAPGTWLAKVECAEMVTEHKVITLDPGTSTEWSVVLRPCGTIVAKMVDERGEIVTGGSVTPWHEKWYRRSSDVDASEGRDGAKEFAVSDDRPFRMLVREDGDDVGYLGPMQDALLPGERREVVMVRGSASERSAGATFHLPEVPKGSWLMTLCRDTVSSSRLVQEGVRSYEIDQLRPGDYRLSAQSFTDPQAILRAAFHLTAGEHLDLGTLQRADNVGRVKVRLPVSARRIEPWYVDVRGREGWAMFGMSSLRPEVTIEMLAGDYNVTSQSLRAGQLFVARAVDVIVAAGEEVAVDIEPCVRPVEFWLQRPEGTAGGTVAIATSAGAVVETATVVIDEQRGILGPLSAPLHHDTWQVRLRDDAGGVFTGELVVDGTFRPDAVVVLRPAE